MTLDLGRGISLLFLFTKHHQAQSSKRRKPACQSQADRHKGTFVHNTAYVHCVFTLASARHEKAHYKPDVQEYVGTYCHSEACGEEHPVTHMVWANPPEKLSLLSFSCDDEKTREQFGCGSGMTTDDHIHQYCPRFLVLSRLHPSITSDLLPYFYGKQMPTFPSLNIWINPKSYRLNRVSLSKKNTWRSDSIRKIPKAITASLRRSSNWKMPWKSTGHIQSSFCTWKTAEGKNSWNKKLPAVVSMH